MTDLDTAFQALSDPTRRAILLRLRAGEASAGELAAPFDISQPAISRHLKTLRAAGLITQRRDGTKRLFSLAPGRLRHVNRFLADLVSSPEVPDAPVHSPRAREGDGLDKAR
ncbi:metalloregulator ArsR/SmtB family transcription factor [Aquicoccus sp. SCR17]|nr:metalloregulator ArsR/SmtB family transcription factor [Carideicomes alvinocaridis]